MQRAFAHFNEIVRSDIYSHNRIHLMTSFFYAGLGEAFCTMGAAGTVRMHMILYVIRSGDDGKMNAVMTFLRSLLLSARFYVSIVAETL